MIKNNISQITLKDGKLEIVKENGQEQKNNFS
jgi:hypothetical protein